MEVLELGAARHSCKVCRKSFPCGRSLGGHMRSHLSLNEVVAAEPEDDEQQLLLQLPSSGSGRSSNGVVGYGLRENPKKTRRLSDFADEEEEDGEDSHQNACRECGKLLPSWRSLFGHMRCHESGAGGHDDVDMEEAFGAEGEEAGEDEEETVIPGKAAAAVAVAVAVAPRRRRRSMRVAAPAPPPPPVLSGFEKEQEDVALCLMMLSRDTGLWSSAFKEEALDKEKNKKQEWLQRNGYNSDDNSALLQYGDAKIKNTAISKSKKRRTSSNHNSISSKQCDGGEIKRGRYECPGCGRAFHSYQALGGHRASYKRINTSCSPPKADRREPSLETNASFSAASASASPDPETTGIGADRSSGKAKKTAEKYECSVCFKVFASGQALGGHKRSHLMAVCANDSELYTNADGDVHPHHSVVVAGFLDLNLPAPSEED